MREISIVGAVGNSAIFKYLAIVHRRPQQVFPAIVLHAHAHSIIHGNNLVLESI